jgi:class 3 adenylate cyclase
MSEVRDTGAQEVAFQQDPIRLCLQSLGTGAAIVDPETWEITFENARFFEWFPPDGDDGDTLERRLADLNVERARNRLERGRPYRFESEVKSGARTLSLGIELRSETVSGQPFLVVECQNISKQKEAEYMLDSYSRMAEKNARELQKEKERVEKLLLNIMPRTVYEEMREFGTTTPQRFEAATVLMLDFVGFTQMAVSRDPSALITELNDIFSSFDRIVELFGCERIKTIGDAYVAVSGLPESNAEHAASIAKVALRMRRYLEKRNAANPNQWVCRIGISTGPVIGSLVGIQKYVYDIFGPAVNLAARLEAFSEPMQITLSDATYAVVKDDFQISELGDYDIRGFGSQTLYTLEDENRSRF